MNAVLIGGIEGVQHPGVASAVLIAVVQIPLQVVERGVVANDITSALHPNADFILRSLALSNLIVVTLHVDAGFGTQGLNVKDGIVV